MTLDTRTLVVVSALISGLLCAISFLYGLHQPRADAIRRWGAATLALTTGLVLLALRGVIADFVSTVLANTLMTLAFVLMRASLLAYRQARDRDVLNAFSFSGGFPIAPWCSELGVRKSVTVMK